MKSYGDKLKLVGFIYYQVWSLNSFPQFLNHLRSYNCINVCAYVWDVQKPMKVNWSRWNEKYNKKAITQIMNVHECDCADIS